MAERVEVFFFHIDGEILGGGSRMLLKLLEGVDTQQFRPKLVLQLEGKVHERARDLKIDVDIVPFRGVLDSYNHSLLTRSPSRLLRTSIRLLQYNRDAWPYVKDADIIWCANLRMVLTLLPQLTISSKPVIWNIGLGTKSNGITTHLNSIALRVVDYVFIESETQARRVFTEDQFNKYQSKFTIFHKGVDTQKFDPNLVHKSTNGPGFTIGTAASITPRKGLADLIDAMPQIFKHHEDVRLQIAGEPSDEHSEYYKLLEAKVERHGIAECVDFLGWVEEMPKYLASLDVFVLPSRNEGIPGSVREALAMEVPVVATDVGGTAEVVRDGETGILVEPENPDAIADAIDYLLSNPEIRAKMGARGRELIVSEFSIESYVSNYEAFLKRIATN